MDHSTVVPGGIYFTDTARVIATLERERGEAVAEISRLRPVTEAARALVSALDYSDPSWRTETLGAGKNGDEVNEAWDALIAALEEVP